MRDEAFPNRKIPEKVYDRLFLCSGKNCHTISLTGAVGCGICDRNLSKRLYRQCKKDEIIKFALDLVFFFIIFYFLRQFLIAQKHNAYILLEIGYICLVMIQIISEKILYKKNVTYRFLVALLDDEDFYNNYQKQIEQIRKMNASEAKKYEILREMSYIYDDELLRKNRLECLEKIQKSRFLDYETDSLITMDKYDERLVRYLYEVSTISPIKIGKLTLQYFLKHSESILNLENGEIMMARTLFSGMRLVTEKRVSFNISYKKELEKVDHNLTPFEREQFDKWKKAARMQ